MHQFRVMGKTIESVTQELVGQIALVCGQGRSGCNPKVSCLRSRHAPGLKNLEGLLLFMLLQIERRQGDMDVSITRLLASRVCKNGIGKLRIGFERALGTAYAPARPKFFNRVTLF